MVPGQRPGKGRAVGMPMGGRACRWRWGLTPVLAGPGDPSAFPVSLSHAAAPGVIAVLFLLKLQQMGLQPAGGWVEALQVGSRERA